MLLSFYMYIVFEVLKSIKDYSVLLDKEENNHYKQQKSCLMVEGEDRSLLITITKE